MCVNNETAKFLKREGLYIDAPIMDAMSILRNVMEKAGFRDGVDMVQMQTQYENQYTAIRITKTVPYCNSLTGEQIGEEMRYFDIKVPDRYVPATHQKETEGVKIVKSIEEVQKLENSLKENSLNNL